MGRENGGMDAVNDRSSWEQNQKGPAPEPIWDTLSNHPPDESCFTIYTNCTTKDTTCIQVVLCEQS